jgi:hypothetical protein
MARRCPDSQYQGHGRLHHFRWQINDRGFANVIPDPDSVVEGLCYLLSAEDERKLDRSEGVPTAYQKLRIEIEFFPAAAKLCGRKVTEILDFDLMERNGSQRSRNRDSRNAQGGEIGLAEYTRGGVTEQTYLVGQDGRPQMIETTGTSRRRGQSVPVGNRAPGEEIPVGSRFKGVSGEATIALIYLSQNHTKKGKPWDEYIDRMNWGVCDAMELGVSKHYVEKSIKPYLLEATGINSIGEPRGRGVREKKKRSKYTNTIKKQRRVVSPERTDSREQNADQIESMDWVATEQNRHDIQEQPKT